jgi:hypothetical protein
VTRSGVAGDAMGWWGTLLPYVSARLEGVEGGGRGGGQRGRSAGRKGWSTGWRGVGAPAILDTAVMRWGREPATKLGSGQRRGRNLLQQKKKAGLNQLNTLIHLKKIEHINFFC